MFGVQIDGSANVFCGNKAVYKNNITPDSVIKKKHHAISYHRFRNTVAAKNIRVAKQGTEKNLSDMFTNIMKASRQRFLPEMFIY